MGDKLLPPGLNVILGDSAGGTFHCAFRVTPECLDIDREVLSCGPTPACESLDAWAVMRTNYWNSIPREPREPPFPVQDVTGRARRLSAAERINLWAGTGLSEQLSVAYTIHLAEGGERTSDKFWSVQFERYGDGREEVYGLGLLDEEAMARHPEPRLLTAAELQHYRDLWVAITSPDPEFMERYPETHPNAGPWLQRAGTLLLRRFPGKLTGLNYWDGALLAECSPKSKKAARVVGETIVKHCGEFDPVGDFFLFGRLMALGRTDLPRPLLEISGTGRHMRYTEVKLTPFGLDVLEGRASNYPANPIDDWAAGVRLSSRDGNLWFNDHGKLVRPSPGSPPHAGT
jgi:hypothetical protein